MASGARPDGLVIVISSEPVVVAPGGCCSRRRCTGASLGYRCGWLPCAGQSGQCGIPDSTATSTKGQGRRARHYTCLPTRSSVPSRGHASELMTYDGSFEIVVHLSAGDSTQLGDKSLRGVLRYQACDDRSSRFPASVPISVPVRVVESGARGNG